VRSIEERVEVDHVARHVIGPFENLWSNVDQECIRGPTSEDHYFCRGVVHEEERHCGSRPKGLVPDFVRVEPEGFESPEYGAGVSEQFFDKFVTYFDSFSIENYRAECRLLVPTWYGCDYSLHCRAPAQNWAKELVTRTGMGSCVHFLSVLLVLEHDGYIMGVLQELWVGVQEDAP